LFPNLSTGVFAVAGVVRSEGVIASSGRYRWICGSFESIFDGRNLSSLVKEVMRDKKAGSGRVLLDG
jgi:hypothetical protein